MAEAEDQPITVSNIQVHFYQPDTVSVSNGRVGVGEGSLVVPHEIIVLEPLIPLEMPDRVLHRKM